MIKILSSIKVRSCMPQKKPNPIQVAPYSGFAAYFNALVYAWEQSNGRRFNKTEVGQKTGINVSLLSKFAHGGVVPTPEQCLIIARFFGQPVEEALRAAGYPDLEGLRAIIATDETLRDPDEKKRVLDILRMAHSSPLWQNISSQNEYKKLADQTLASSNDSWQKATDYVRIVWFWYNSTQQDTPLKAWNTQEMLVSAGVKEQG